MIQTTHRSAGAFFRSLNERPVLLALTLAAAALRFWAPGAKGLWYDEAITAAMTQLASAEIVRFHWQAAFTHLPGWYLLVNGWARVFGTSEYALRLPSVMAGIAAVPLFWQLLCTTRPSDRGLRLIATALLAGSPLLVLYSQEARMYSLALALALASLYLFVRLTTHERIGLLLALVAVNWAMIALQYYYALLVGIEGLFLTLRIIRRRYRPLPLFAALVISLLPLLWRGLSPGFWGTANALATAEHNTDNLPLLLDAAWRDLTFGMVIWRPPQAAIGYLLVAPVLMGLIFAGRRRAHPDAGRADNTAIRWPGLFLLTICTAGAITALVPEHFQVRYILYVEPLLLTFIALGIVETWRRLRPAGALLFVATLAVIGGGLYHYFTIYQRSEYREMARYLDEHAHPGSVVLLEGPRQHLLADYYLPKSLKFVPVPDVPLPAHLPVDAPLVVPGEVDRQLKPLLEAEPDLWLILAGENEVDPGEFVLSYLHAVSYGVECRDWLDVTLCHFVTPQSIAAGLTRPLYVVFDGEMRLAGAHVTPFESDDERAVLVELEWRTEAKPTRDYKITLRLLDLNGQVVSQVDDYPIGPLLPPTTWAENSTQTSWLALPLPADLPQGAYRLGVALYDPQTLQMMAIRAPRRSSSNMVWLALVRVGETIQVRPAPPRRSS